jgi:hypothetical protein
MTFNDALNAALKYQTEDWNAFQRLLTEQPHHRWGGPSADHTLRKVAADAYQEATSDEEGADLLRDENQHVVLHDGKVKAGQLTDKHISEAYSQLLENLYHQIGHPVANSEQIDYYRDLMTHWRDIGGQAGTKTHIPSFHKTVLYSDRRSPNQELIHMSELPNRLADAYEHHMNDYLGLDVGEDDGVETLRNAPYEEPVE